MKAPQNHTSLRPISGEAWGGVLAASFRVPFRSQILLALHGCTSLSAPFILQGSHQRSRSRFKPHAVLHAGDLGSGSGLKEKRCNRHIAVASRQYSVIFTCPLCAGRYGGGACPCAVGQELHSRLPSSTLLHSHSWSLIRRFHSSSTDAIQARLACSSCDNWVCVIFSSNLGPGGTSSSHASSSS